MKIKRVAAGHAADGKESRFQPHARGLSLVIENDYATNPSGSAGLIGEALYGVSPASVPSGWLSISDGEITVEDKQGEYLLRRHGGTAGPRLTIRSGNGQPADTQTVERLTFGLSPRLLGRVYYWRRHDRDLLSGLLADTVAAEYRRAVGANESRVSVTETVSSTSRYARRDALAAEIETLLADRRRASGDLEQAAADLESRLAIVSGQRAEADRRLQSVVSELEELETRLRYHAIAEAAEREAGAHPPTDWAPQLDEIEEEITRWRATLADLEQRESALRGELAQVHPDDASSVLPLADQRAAIAVASRLTRDIESEVARLARAADSNACVCNDAHPRLNPLVDTLGQQLRRLEELANQQERALRAQELQAEVEHVARSQQDLRRQLDHLLKRRQELWRSGRPRRYSSSAEGLNGFGSDDFDSAASASRRSALQQEAVSLRADVEQSDAEIAELRRQRDAIANERNGLMADDHLLRLQRELDEAQRSLSVTTHQTVTDTTPFAGVGRWRASELFAKLTDGRFRSLQLIAGGRDLVAIDAHGYERASHALGDQDRDLAAISLMIAMAAGLAQHGMDLPMILDEPFAMLDARHASILANLLEDYAREGRQVLVMTGRREAIERFAALGVQPLGYLQHEVTPAVTRVEDRVRPQVIETRVVETNREYLLDHDDPIERFPALMSNRSGVFARARVRTIGDLLSADPSALAEELDRDDITAELVALWQTHLSLVCFVPGLSFDDAIALTAAGVYSPEDLAEIDSETLYESINGYLSSDAGARLREKGYAIDRERTRDFVRRAGRGVSRWSSTDHWNRWSRHRGERRQRVSNNASRRTRSSRRSDRSSSNRSTNGSRRSNGASRLRVRSDEGDRLQTRQYKKAKKEAPKRRWYLEVGSPIVDAPSIGPKTAIKLERVGLRTVDDLIQADAAEIAERLDARNIDAEKIVAWQHQAQLVCRIPRLRGHDAQILVASGFTAPEEIATMKPSELLEFIEPFCSSSDGQRVLRNSSPPDLEEVTNWIAWSRESRALDAA